MVSKSGQLDELFHEQLVLHETAEYLVNHEIKLELYFMDHLFIQHDELELICSSNMSCVSSSCFMSCVPKFMFHELCIHSLDLEVQFVAR
jgi:hypothetical protein